MNKYVGYFKLKYFGLQAMWNSNTSIKDGRVEHHCALTDKDGRGMPPYARAPVIVPQ